MAKTYVHNMGYVVSPTKNKGYDFFKFIKLPIVMCPQKLVACFEIAY
jgi:hypothetical protein